MFWSFFITSDIFKCQNLFVLRFYGPVNTIKVMLSWSTPFLDRLPKRLTSTNKVPILSPVTDNSYCLTWISGRERMAVEITVRLNLYKRYVWMDRGSNPQPPEHQLDRASSDWPSRPYEAPEFVTCIEPRQEKTCFCPMRTTKAQISLRIRAVLSTLLLFTA